MLKDCSTIELDPLWWTGEFKLNGEIPRDKRGREDEDEEKAAASTMEIKGESRSGGEMTRAQQPCKTLGFL